MIRAEYFPRHTETNKEGLTFIEWLCAAGKKYAQWVSESVFVTTGVFKPYPYEECHPDHYALTCAWRNGEDPTEYRA